MSSLKYDIHVTTILHKALEALLQVKQWLSVGLKTTGSALMHLHRAEALIELVEIHDCSSSGGFGRGQRGNDGKLKYSDEYSEIFARWYFLMEKYSPSIANAEEKEVSEAKEYFEALRKNEISMHHSKHQILEEKS